MLLPILLWLILLPILLWLILLLVVTWRLRVGGGMRLVNVLMLVILHRCWVGIELAQCWVPAGGVRRHWLRRIWSREQAGPD
jgi:hypothetical protein